MSQNNNTLLFPTSANHKIREAIDILVKGDGKTALTKLITLVNENCFEAFYFIGALYEVGKNGIEKDNVKAEFYYEKSAEYTGDKEAYLGLARLYYNGNGVPLNYEKVFEYYKLVADECQDPFAFYMLGRMYYLGQYVEVDLNIARDYCEKAWKGGCLLGLTFLGLIEQKMGRKFIGAWFRIQAGYLGIKLLIKDKHDPGLRDR